ncbi:glutathione S-transferase family protein [Roseicella frigidaeris]|uniref:Glutathione S-transferase family protein n=1 Tax=Roseicella frigidaeris TaxID=2230885 RepID=A0A327M5T1_9PROT|nr:glutathione S-transferase family protein [Roseicella frigidaeris]RAI58661.1 glutathione S-transferase family protein [Roseicella frigidaeris]
MPAPVILHQYDFSPFSEKVRLAFGLKGMEWHAVDVPIAMPKPDLMPLTNGYRRAPVMQIGADMYCDTLLILREIERRQPAPSLYPDGQQGLAHALSYWVERTTFVPAAALATSVIGDQLPAEFIEERKAFMNHDFSKEASLRERPLNLQRLHAHLSWLGQMLEGGRPFLLGDRPSAADLSAYHTLWFARKNGGPTVEAALPLGPLLRWMDRVAALGHGTRHDMPAGEALAVAKASEPDLRGMAGDEDPSGLRAGQAVRVSADDRGRDPVRGVLVGADANEVVIRHENERVGAVHIHFPRAGFDVVAD